MRRLAWRALGLMVIVIGVAAGVATRASDAQTPPGAVPLGDPAPPAAGGAERAASGTRGGGAGSPHDVLVKGNALYEEGRYEEAAQAYETALSYGIENEVLHFNLGNAYFRLGRLGPAILAYERAELLAPGDPDIHANLEFARARASDVPPGRDEGPISIVRGWLSKPGINGSAAVALIAYLVGAALMGLALVSKRRRHPMVLALGLVAWVLAIPPALVVVTQGAAREWDQRAVVMSERVECRSGPGASNPVLFAVHEGTTVQVVDERAEWSRISLPDGLNGWLPTSSIDRVRRQG